MELKSATYISRRAWGTIFPEIRRAILRVTRLKRTDIVNTTMYISTLQNLLRNQGEHDLANALTSMEQLEHFKKYVTAQEDELHNE